MADGKRHTSEFGSANKFPSTTDFGIQPAYRPAVEVLPQVPLRKVRFYKGTATTFSTPIGDLDGRNGKPRLRWLIINSTAFGINRKYQ